MNTAFLSSVSLPLRLVDLSVNAFETDERSQKRGKIVDEYPCLHEKDLGIIPLTHLEDDVVCYSTHHDKEQRPCRNKGPQLPLN
jgi:hypothetical protein